MRRLYLPIFFLPMLASAEVIETELRIVGGDESGTEVAFRTAFGAMAGRFGLSCRAPRILASAA